MPGTPPSSSSSSHHHDTHPQHPASLHASTSPTHHNGDNHATSPNKHAHSHGHSHGHGHGHGESTHAHYGATSQYPDGSRTVDGVLLHDIPAHHWHSRGLWQKPKLLIDWYNIGQEDGRKISWSELFFDLVYVTVIGKLGEDLRANEIAISHYFIMLTIIFQFWLNSTQYSTRFNNDDLYHKIYYGLFMLGVFGMGMHVKGGISGENSSGFVVSCVYLCLLIWLTNLRIYYHIPRTRRTLSVTLVFQVLAALIWTCCLFVPASSRMYVVLTAAFVEMIKTPICVTIIPRHHALPLHLDHYVERFGLFVIIVLGESVTGVTLNPTESKTSPSVMYLSAALGFVMIWSFKLLYFDVDTQDHDNHAIRRSKYTAMAWTYSHVVLVCSLAIVGSGLELLCGGEISGEKGGEGGEGGESGEGGSVHESGGEVTHATGHSTGHHASPAILLGRSLIETTFEAGREAASASASNIRARWFVCGGISVSYIMLSFMRLLHSRADIQSTVGVLYVGSMSLSSFLTGLYWVQIAAQCACSFGALILAVLSDRGMYAMSDVGLLLYLAITALGLVALNLVDEAVIYRAVNKFKTAHGWHEEEHHHDPHTTGRANSHQIHHHTSQHTPTNGYVSPTYHTINHETDANQPVTHSRSPRDVNIDVTDVTPIAAAARSRTSSLSGAPTSAVATSSSLPKESTLGVSNVNQSAPSSPLVSHHSSRSSSAANSPSVRTPLLQDGHHRSRVSHPHRRGRPMMRRAATQRVLIENGRVVGVKEHTPVVSGSEEEWSDTEVSNVIC